MLMFLDDNSLVKSVSSFYQEDKRIPTSQVDKTSGENIVIKQRCKLL